MIRYDYSQPYITRDEYLEVKGVDLNIELQDDDNHSNKVNRFIQDITNFVLDHLVMEYNCNELNRQTNEFEDLAEFRRVRFHYGMLEQIEYVLNNGLIQLDSGINRETGAITDFSGLVIGSSALKQFRLGGFCNKQEGTSHRGDLSPKDMPTVEELVLELAKKVDKVDGKGLSTNDFSNAYKSIINSLSQEMNNKVDKVDGKTLSANDFTDALKEKLLGIEENAQENKIEEIRLNNESVSPSGKIVNISAQDSTYKVTSLSEESTDEQYPSAKAVYTALEVLRNLAEGKTKTFAVNPNDAGNEAFLSGNSTITATSFVDINGNSYDVSELHQGDLVYTLNSESVNYKDRWLIDPANGSWGVIDADAPDLEGYVTKGTTQTITGYKTFSNGADINGNSIKLSGFVDTIIRPRYNDTYDIGTSLLKWKDLYLSGSIYVSKISNGTNEIYFDQYNQITLGTTAGYPVISSGALLPRYTSAYNIGISSLKWKDIFFSGSLRDGNNANYGFTLPNSTNLEANSELLDSASEQEVTGIKSFKRQIKFINQNNVQKWDIYLNDNDLLVRENYSGGNPSRLMVRGTTMFTCHLTPISSKTYDVGSANSYYKDAYFSGTIRTHNAVGSSGDYGTTEVKPTGITVYKDIASEGATVTNFSADVDGNVLARGNLNLGGIIKTTDNFTYGFELPDSTNFTADSELLDSASAQTITGPKTFSDGALKTNRINPASNDNNYFVFTAADFAWYINAHFGPVTNGTRDLGRSAYPWKDGYFSGQVYAQNTLNVINTSEMTDSTHFSEAQYNLIVNGKQTRVIGTISGRANMLITSVLITSSNAMCRFKAGLEEGVLTISIASRAISIDGVEQKDVSLRSIGSINGKVLADYPFSPTEAKGIIYDTDNTMKWQSVALKGTETPITGTFGQFGNFTIPLSSLTDGLYVFTYANVEAFVFITQSMLNSSPQSAIRVPCACVYDANGSSAMGTLMITKLLDTVLFTVVDDSGRKAYEGLTAYLIKTKLM